MIGIPVHADPFAFGFSAPQEPPWITEKKL